ncbi:MULTISPECIES: SH3 domain-containing protein [Marinobacter]|uniref:SH3 domain-containing protein n=1 Tax=Marinobacter suaedae TaxID=3057675 RepID=A0ABT8VY75_9GAMM|nr:MULTISPECIES: SH3 domain-containing protein [unclassified Marinobacter]MBZ2169080.1 SH3 domain-containing protein [Marinobacter sp. F4216]MDO3720949.1 SH3 domain-containing protein [Marinobacter sp. chi1]
MTLRLTPVRTFSRHLLVGLMLATPVAPVTAQTGFENEAAVLEVVDPFIELHTAPGRGYPVFHVIEKGEQVELIKRKTNWYKVRSAEGEEGWTKAAQLGRTLQPTGLPADLPEVSHGEYLESSWRVGFTTGLFEESTSFSLTVGYRPLTWVGAELEAGKIYNRSVTSDYYSANLIFEPMNQWDITPYAVTGISTFSFDARQKVLLSDLGDADGFNVGGGLSYYIGRNFLVRAEYRMYSVSSNSESTGLSEWKFGLNTFF